ncbi:MAG: RbsD/FucU domain-containing protein [Luteolibacter sp.]
MMNNTHQAKLVSCMNAFRGKLLVTFITALSSLSTAWSADWKSELASQSALLGHRNMIIVADSAYPIQTGTGVKVISTNAPHLEVVQAVAKAIASSPGIVALPALDKEFSFIPENYAPGAAKLRESIVKSLATRGPIREELHATLLKEVNQTAAEYAVIVFKTTGTIPYSSVFFTLDCGYWSPEAEKVLRENMAK